MCVNSVCAFLCLFGLFVCLFVLAVGFFMSIVFSCGVSYVFLLVLLFCFSM